MNLRQFARGQPCTVRLPDVCDGGGETTVLAHLRKFGLAGTGQKPDDRIAVHACAPCHDVIDGRTPRPEWIPEASLEMACFAALCRTLVRVGGAFREVYVGG